MSSVALSRYLADVRRHPVLTREEELRLARAASSDDRARRVLVESNLRLVLSIARRYQGLGLDLPDLVQEGNIGLVHAVDRFDWRRGVRFSTFASWWIKHTIRLALSTSSRTIRIPRRVAESGPRIRRAEAELAQRLGRSASAEQVAQAAGVDVDVVAMHRRAELALVSLSEPGVEEGDPLEDRLPDPGTPDPVDAIADDDMQRRVHAAIAGLTPRDRRVLTLRFGLDGEAPRSLADVAERLGVSRPRVQYIEKRALRALASDTRLQSLRAAA